MNNIKVTQVWASNFIEELQQLDLILQNHRVIFMDTEFPGFLRKTPRRSNELKVFSDMKFNVDRMRIIQLGITVSNDNGIIAGTWEFNFKFLLEWETFDGYSIEFLTESGIEFEELRNNGIDMELFSRMFTQVLYRHRNLIWITFHGLYDFAYVMKLITKQPLPSSIMCFTNSIARIFGCCLDIKYMARFYNGLQRGELGLEKLAKILRVKRVGGAHQAGSDSLLTARVFIKMKTTYGIDESRFTGLLYGLSPNICKPMSPQVLQFPRYCQPRIPQVLPSCYAQPMLHRVFLQPPAAAAPLRYVVL